MHPTAPRRQQACCGDGRQQVARPRPCPVSLHKEDRFLVRKGFCRVPFLPLERYVHLTSTSIKLSRLFMTLLRLLPRGACVTCVKETPRLKATTPSLGLPAASSLRHFQLGQNSTGNFLFGPCSDSSPSLSHCPRQPVGFSDGVFKISDLLISSQNLPF